VLSSFSHTLNVSILLDSDAHLELLHFVLEHGILFQVLITVHPLLHGVDLTLLLL
jgi:hypothetical protein